MQEPDELRNASTPEQALLRGVLEQALLDLRKFSRGGGAGARAVAGEIRDWMASDEYGATMGGFTFVFVCDQLKLSPDYMRELARRFDVTGRGRERARAVRAGEAA